MKSKYCLECHRIMMSYEYSSEKEFEETFFCSNICEKNYEKRTPEVKKKNKDIILKVYSIKKSGQKLITIPKESDINVGDYVKIKKIDIQDDF